MKSKICKNCGHEKKYHYSRMGTYKCQYELDERESVLKNGRMIPVRCGCKKFEEEVEICDNCGKVLLEHYSGNYCERDGKMKWKKPKKPQNQFEGSITCGKCGKTWSVCECEKEGTFNLSEKIRTSEKLGKQRFIPVRNIKTFIKQGDKIFYAEDYGNDKVPNEMFNYATEKWEKFKKLAGDELI